MGTTGATFGFLLELVGVWTGAGPEEGKKDWQQEESVQDSQNDDQENHLHAGFVWKLC